MTYSDLISATVDSRAVEASVAQMSNPEVVRAAADYAAAADQHDRGADSHRLYVAQCGRDEVRTRLADGRITGAEVAEVSDTVARELVQ